MSVFQQLRERCLPLTAMSPALTKECFESVFRLMLSKLPQLEKKVNKVAVAVSGGPDSLTVLAAAVHFFGRERVTAISVNHQLKEVDESAEKIEELVRPFGVEFVGKSIEWPQGQPPVTPRVQLKARESRYKLIGEECQKRGISLLLLGHNQDDDIATALYRMGRSSGLDGLAGMKHILPLPLMHPSVGRLDAQGHITGIFVGRPFLHIPKSQLVATCEEHIGKALYDPTNSSPQFHRNDIISALRESKVDLSRLIHFLETFKRLRFFLIGQIASLMRSSVVLDRNNGSSMFVLNSPHLLESETKPLLMRTINILLQYSAAVHRPMKLRRLNDLYALMQTAYAEHLREEAAKKENLPRQFRSQPTLPIDQTKRLPSGSYSLGGGVIYPLSRMHALKRLSYHNQRLPNREIKFGPGFLIQSSKEHDASQSDISPNPHEYLLFDKRVYLRPSVPVDTVELKWSVEPLDVKNIKMYEACARQERSARLPLQALLATTPMTHTYQLPVIISENRKTEEIVYMVIPTIGAQWTNHEGIRKSGLKWEYVHSGECILSSRFLCLP